MDEGGRIDRRSFLARSAAAGAAVAGGGAALDACSSSPTATTTSNTASVGRGPTGPPKHGGSMVIAMNSEIDGFQNASNHWDNTGLTYAHAVYDPLILVGEDGTAKPCLATSVTSNPDKTVWTLTLRPNVVFHDGSALDADVVLANFAALKASALTGGAFNEVQTFSKIDDMTVQINLVEPVVSFPFYLGTQVGFVTAKAQLNNTASGSTKPIGTGPFKLESWIPNEALQLSRNEHYWRSGLPYLDSLTFHPIVSDESREATLLSGGCDACASRDTQLFIDLQHNTNYQYFGDSGYTTGEPEQAFILLNCGIAPLSDLRLRQGLAYATDVPTVIKVFGNSLGQPSNGLFPVGSPYYSDTGYPTYDLNKAKSLIAAVKADHGPINIKLSTITDPRLVSLVQLLQQMWQAAGVTVTIAEVQQAEFIVDLALGSYQAATLELFDTPDPDLNYVWLSTTTDHPVGSVALNFARNSDPIIQQNLQIGRTSLDTSKRIAAYKAVNERLAKDLPYLWLGRELWTLGADKRVGNLNAATLPDGGVAEGFRAGVIRTVEMWMSS